MRLHAPNVDVALYWTPTYLFTLGILAVIACVIATYDFYLGIFALYMTVRVLWTQVPNPIYTVWTITLSCVAIVIVQRLAPRYRVLATRILIVSAALQILVGVGQAFGYNPIWYGWEQIPVRRVYGTFGNSGQLGSFIALTFAFIPTWITPWWVIGTVLSQSFTAAGVLLVIACLRYRKHWPLVVIGAGVSGILLNYVRPLATNMVPNRLLAWKAGWDIALQRPITGYGPNSWAEMVPVFQNANQHIYTKEAFREAHNELLGLFFEGGIIAVIIIGLWIWDHKAWRSQPLIAMGIVCFWWFPFHFPAMLPIALLLIGLETPYQQPVKTQPQGERRHGKKH